MDNKIHFDEIPPAYDDAITYLQEKVGLSSEAFEALSAACKSAAFTVGGVASADLRMTVLDALRRAVERGESLSDFRDRIGDQLKRSWGDSVSTPGFRIETIWRTNMQRAYSAGRYAGMTDPVTLKLRPFWRFIAIDDNRISPICKRLSNLVLPASDPFWESGCHIPPLHHCCRSKLIPLRKRQAEKLGIDTAPKDVNADEGFGAKPDQPFQPDLSKYPDAIRRKLELKDTD